MKTGIGFSIANMVPSLPPNILGNSQLSGAVSGSPGTPATGWALVQTGGTLTSAGDTARIVIAAARNYWQRTITVAANTTYFLSILAEVTTAARVDNLLNTFSIPAGASTSFFIDGVEVAGSVLPSVGSRVLGVRLIVAGTAGTASFNFGGGVTTGASTSDVTFSKPMANIGTSRTHYIAT